MSKTLPTHIAIAKALVFNEKNEALVLRIGTHVKRPERSYTPDLPGGTGIDGESMLEVMVRETFEETGIHIDPSSAALLASESTEETGGAKVFHKHLFVVYIGDTPEVVLSDEHDEFRWAPINELETIAFSPFYVSAIGSYLKRYVV